MARGEDSSISVSTRTRCTSKVPARLALPAPERGFRLLRSDGLVLCAPANGEKMRAIDWREDERIYRSVVVREEDGSVVSLGFPKFFNFGEHEQDTERLRNALASADTAVVHTEKIDGSLVIRSVIDGKVVLRTRGTLDGGAWKPVLGQLAHDRYPSLLDPDWQSDRSLLFEFVSHRPDHQVVLRHEQEQLILVGGITHNDLRVAPLSELVGIAIEGRLDLVPLHELPDDPVELTDAVGAWQGREGIVCRVEGHDGVDALVKMKSAAYLALHRLRFALTARAIREVCTSRDIRSEEQFEQYLAEQGGDWELVQEAKHYVGLFLAARADAEARLARLAAEVEEMRERHRDDRRSFARSYALTLASAETHAAFSLLDGRTGDAFQLLLRDALDRIYLSAEQEDERYRETSV